MNKFAEVVKGKKNIITKGAVALGVLLVAAVVTVALKKDEKPMEMEFQDIALDTPDEEPVLDIQPATEE